MYIHKKDVEEDIQKICECDALIKVEPTRNGRTWTFTCTNCGKTINMDSDIL